MMEIEISSAEIEGKSGLDARRHRGSFYTPADASLALWRNLLHCLKVGTDRSSLLEWISKTHIVDPACGTGIFLLTLLRLLLEAGISLEEGLSKLRFTCVDNNRSACRHLTKTLEVLFDRLGVAEQSTSELYVIHGDGIEYLQRIYNGNERLDRTVSVVGNPPYVTIRSELQQNWQDLGFRVSDVFALFVYWASVVAKKLDGSVALIVPLSITFSKHHTELRKTLFSLSPQLHVTHYDNIPDAIFCTGKPDSENSNRANSQRVTFFCCRFNSESKCRVQSSRLISWRRSMRHNVLSQVPTTFTVEPFGPHVVIPKPTSRSDIALFLNPENNELATLGDLVVKGGEYSIWISATARNYLPAALDRFKTSGVMKFELETAEDAQFVFMVACTSKFFRYWKCVGDGFHVTRLNVLSFPLHPSWLNAKKKLAQLGEQLWEERMKFRKMKINAGTSVTSYDFGTSDEVSEADEILKLDASDSSWSGSDSQERITNKNVD